MLLKEMAEYSYATYAESFINHFDILIKDIPRTNNFSAEVYVKSIEDLKFMVKNL